MGIIDDNNIKNKIINIKKKKKKKKKKKIVCSNIRKSLLCRHLGALESGESFHYDHDLLVVGGLVVRVLMI